MSIKNNNNIRQGKTLYHVHGIGKDAKIDKVFISSIENANYESFSLSSKPIGIDEFGLTVSSQKQTKVNIKTKAIISRDGKIYIPEEHVSTLFDRKKDAKRAYSRQKSFILVFDEFGAYSSPNYINGMLGMCSSLRLEKNYCTLIYPKDAK